MNADVSAVYRGPLDGFVERRNALAKEFRSTNAEAASAMTRLRKPSVGAWAIDQLAAEDTDLLARLLAAGADLRQVQHDVAAGSADGSDLAAASARVREMVDAAVAASGRVLVEAGHPASDETMRRIRTTLHGAIAGPPPMRLALFCGTLDRDLEPAGFGAIDTDDDLPDVAVAISPFRRGPTSGRPRESAPAPGAERAARRVAERVTAEAKRAAEMARAFAITKRQNAGRLTDEARRADEEAVAAEVAADAAEEVLRRLGDGRSHSAQP